MKIQSVFATLLILSAGISMSACHHASTNETSKHSKNGEAFPESSDILSKWVRANARDFWQHAKESSTLSAYASYSGTIVGDAHLANFSVMPVTLNDGSVAMRYLDIDFDDAGHGPFALDLLRLVATSKATKKDVKVGAMTDAYIKGLHGEGMTAPVEVGQLLVMTTSQYASMADQEVDDKTKKDAFKIKPGKIEAYSGPITKEMIAPLLPNVNILDLALRPKEDGGSTGLRLWVFGKTAQGARRLYELKEVQETSLTAYEPQTQDLGAWYTQVHEAFWQGVDAKEYRIVTVPGNGSFWLREKKVSLIDIPYSSTKKTASEMVMHLAEYDAYILGTLHAKQTLGGALAKALSDKAAQDTFSDAVKNAAKDYLNYATQAIIERAI